MFVRCMCTLEVVTQWHMRILVGCTLKAGKPRVVERVLGGDARHRLVSKHFRDQVKTIGVERRNRAFEAAARPLGERGLVVGESFSRRW
jgi:hypothetical protein